MACTLKFLSLLLVICAVLETVYTQESSTSTYHPRKLSRHRQDDRETENERGNEDRVNKTGSGLGSGDVEFHEKDKYYEDEDEYTYDDDARSNETGTAIEDDDEEEEDKFVEKTSGIILDHVDFVLLRLKHISTKTSSNISDILALQKEEFKVNTHYKQGWDTAVKIFNETKREKIFKNTKKDSIVRQVPEEYHIALVAYSLGEPAMYYHFNKDTREVCSGTDIDHYQWKSYFKLLQLAVQTLGSREERWRDNQRFLYRGASSPYQLKEGQVLAFQHFISTSAALTSAEDFAEKTIFEFQGFYNGTAMAIWDHSFYEHEKEVLFSPLQVFEVDSIHVGSHYTRYVLVKHDITPCKQETTPKNSDDAITNTQDLMGNSLRVYTSSGPNNVFSHEKSFFLVTFLMCYFAIILK